MYLTRMELDIKKRETMKALISPNLFHGAIESAFFGEKTRKLWRIDNIRQHYYLLLLSDVEPKLSNVVSQFGFDETNVGWETKDYKVLLNRVENNSNWHFRLIANPTKSCRQVGKRGKIQAHITPYYQKQWLVERCEKHGFSLLEEDFDVVESKWYKFYKKGNRNKQVTMLSVTYEGKLTVIDKEKFTKTLTDGIGREKAYGMGMLTIIK